MLASFGDTFDVYTLLAEWTCFPSSSWICVYPLNDCSFISLDWGSFACSHTQLDLRYALSKGVASSRYKNKYLTSCRGWWDIILSTLAVSPSKKKGLNTAAQNINRLILLHGPPGTGKSSLWLDCWLLMRSSSLSWSSRALAHKVSIRLGHIYRQSQIWEIDSQAILSKFFSESGKLVAKMFDKIIVAAEDSESLICVIIDEVESLTGSREKASSGSECGDALRVRKLDGLFFLELLTLTGH